MKLSFLHKSILIISFCILFVSCEKTDNTIPQDLEINDFVWKGMNLFYYWQDNIPDLQDTRFSSQSQLNSFLDDFSAPDELFESLLYQPKIEDRFSVIVDDYIALENAFQGRRIGNGMRFGLVRYVNNPANVFGYVRYVVPASDADNNGVSRGLLFNKIDGVQITEDNYLSLISQSTYTISVADYNNGNPIENGTTITLTEGQLQELPVHEVKVLTEGNHRIGYIMYNQFSSEFDQILNYAFSLLQQASITDLVVDLRYNGGGSTTTAGYLGSMITGQFQGEIFSRETWNTKITSNFDDSYFVNNFTNTIRKDGISETINNLGLNSVYFLVSGSTASASELLINSLSSYIDVYTIGTKTVGKVHGSVTLYDSEDYSRDGKNLNQNHNWALQPLVLEIFNKDGNNHPTGITPDIVFQEDYSNLGVIGERSDPTLERAIQLISTGARTTPIKNPVIEHKEIGNSNMLNVDFNRMYTDKKMGQ